MLIHVGQQGKNTLIPLLKCDCSEGFMPHPLAVNLTVKPAEWKTQGRIRVIRKWWRGGGEQGKECDDHMRVGLKCLSTT